MDQSAISRTLVSEGFAITRKTKKLTAFERASETVYLKNTSKSHPLVIGSKNSARLSVLMQISGVLRTKSASAPYHNSNMTAFDKRMNGGRKPTRYGFDFDFASEKSLRALLDCL